MTTNYQTKATTVMRHRMKHYELGKKCWFQIVQGKIMWQKILQGSRITIGLFSLIKQIFYWNVYVTHKQHILNSLPKLKTKWSFLGRLQTVYFDKLRLVMPFQANQQHLKLFWKG